MRRLLGLGAAFILITVFAYVSRFWIFNWWGREGLFGIEALRPRGEIWARWMRDLGLAPYELVLWAVAVFVVLTLMQKLWGALFSSE